MLKTSPTITFAAPPRILTAAALFDGHDASINIMRRILQSAGAEVIHLGHNRSVLEVVQAALQEDVQAIAVSSYQGGHMEYFKYLYDLLQDAGAGHIQIFGGGGGVIVPDEIQKLHEYGIRQIFSPEDGRRLGLQGMIESMLQAIGSVEQPVGHDPLLNLTNFYNLAQAITILENTNASQADATPAWQQLQKMLQTSTGSNTPVIGVTGPGGAGKSSLTDEICLRLLIHNSEIKIALLAIDPTRRKTGGALLGDRIRLNTPGLFPERLFVRSLASRSADMSLSAAVPDVLRLLKIANFDIILVETSGIGQSESAITKLVDHNLYVMTAEFGAPTQLEKIAMLDYADLVALNKAEKRGSEDALNYIKKQYQRNHELFERDISSMPVIATIASRYQDSGVNTLYNNLLRLPAIQNLALNAIENSDESASERTKSIIPTNRERYLSEIAEHLRKYNQNSIEQSQLAGRIEALYSCIKEPQLVKDNTTISRLKVLAQTLTNDLDPGLKKFLDAWPELHSRYSADKLTIQISGKEITQLLHKTSLSETKIPVVALPRTKNATDLAQYYYKENLPGSFPYTAAVFPFRKEGEDPTRMFAGEGGPERTNRRFHYLTGHAHNGEVARLSTAFDSVTLYGEDPARRPDIYGKIGNAGVSVACLDDCKRLYSGFDLCAPGTSVSMTINGPAPILLAYFFNTAIDQKVEAYLEQNGRLAEARKKITNIYAAAGQKVPVYREELPTNHDGRGLKLLGMSGADLIDSQTYQNIKQEVLKKIRGTVQADILKEDQAQNTCIFSTQFALRMMGDIQQSFTQNGVRNFYSVSISGYHMAEAGANPITQLAFTLANGFTYVEYYLSRGLNIDSFAPNLSFFFSNGLDAEYAVIGRVARRIWSVAMQRLYKANDRSQKLKYHIQTSGRSLHAREIDFNDIRTTLQALYAIYDNCNSLHTNAYDEAITTPTEESVRRALAIQLIINRELGLNQNQNVLQGSYIIEELTDLVEEAVLAEFDRLTERGGVLGAMETMYQRSRIQQESLDYEHKKHSGDLPIIGVNTFINPDAGEQTITELIRSTEAEKQMQIAGLQDLNSTFGESQKAALETLANIARRGENIFEALLETTRMASLGAITGTLYGVGGSYRRNM